jgi:hypothetical protein
MIKPVDELVGRLYAQAEAEKSPSRRNMLLLEDISEAIDGAVARLRGAVGAAAIAAAAIIAHASFEAGYHQLQTSVLRQGDAALGGVGATGAAPMLDLKELSVRLKSVRAALLDIAGPGPSAPRGGGAGGC